MSFFKTLFDHRSDQPENSASPAVSLPGIEDVRSSLRFLHMRANHDFRNAQIHPIPEDLKANVKLFNGPKNINEIVACTHGTLELMGGYPALFREIILGVPNAGFRYDPSQPMVCITGLELGLDGELSARIEGFSSL